MTTTSITLQPGESITITAAGGTGPVPPDPHPQPIPGESLTLTFDGVVRDTSRMSTSQMTALGSFTVPNSIGQVTSFKAFEHGTASVWKWGWLTQDPSSIDAQHPQVQGTGISLTMSIGIPRQGLTTVQPGQIWWVVVRNQKFSGAPSCGAGLNCNFGYSMDVPS